MAVDPVTFARPRHCDEAAIVSRGGRLTRSFSARGDVEFSFWGWSPDGARLAYVRSDCNAKFPRETLFLAGARGRDTRVAEEFAYEFIAVEWAPDGRRIAFALAPDTVRLMVVDLATRARRVVAHHVSGRAAWAAQTDEIVFRQDYPQARIVAVSADGARTRVLRGGHEIEAASANGNHILVRASPRAPRAVMDVATARMWLLPRAAQRRLVARRGAVAYFLR